MGLPKTAAEATAFAAARPRPTNDELLRAQLHRSRAEFARLVTDLAAMYDDLVAADDTGESDALNRRIDTTLAAAYGHAEAVMVLERALGIRGAGVLRDLDLPDLGVGSLLRPTPSILYDVAAATAPRRSADLRVVPPWGE